jgi:hypothetical protein
MRNDKEPEVLFGVALSLGKSSSNYAEYIGFILA